jgi:hypothetical protein
LHARDLYTSIYRNAHTCTHTPFDWFSMRAYVCINSKPFDSRPRCAHSPITKEKNEQSCICCIHTHTTHTHLLHTTHIYIYNTYTHTYTVHIIIHTHSHALTPPCSSSSLLHSLGSGGAATTTLFSSHACRCVCVCVCVCVFVDGAQCITHTHTHRQTHIYAYLSSDVATWGGVCVHVVFHTSTPTRVLSHEGTWDHTHALHADAQTRRELAGVGRSTRHRAVRVCHSNKVE